MGALPQTQVLVQRQPSRIAIKANGKILFINPAEVVAVEARRNYVLLQQESGAQRLRGSISTMAEKLTPYGFVRIHRSWLVNAAFIEEVHSWFTGEYSLRLKGGRAYSVSRGYKKNLSLLVQSCTGGEHSAGK